MTDPELSKLRAKFLALEGDALIGIHGWHCPKGHPLSGSNILPQGPNGKHRKCRECTYESNRQGVLRKKASINAADQHHA